MFKRAYWAFAYLGLMAIWASFILGFRYEPEAPAANVFINLLLYAAFITVHIIMTTPAFKGVVYGQRAGSPMERRIYIAVAVVSWVFVYWLHRPVGGFGWVAPLWLHYLGLCAYLLCIVGFFEFATFEGLAQLVGLPDAGLSHS